MKHHRPTLVAALAVFSTTAFVLSSVSANAQTTYIYDQNVGGARLWEDAGNWQGGSIPDPVAGDTIQANLTMTTADTTLDLGADRTFEVWTSNFQGFGPNGFTINSGYTITLAGTTPRITHSGKGSVTMENILAGTGGLLLNGSQTVALNNASNSFSGGIELANGTLQAGSDGALGDVGNNLAVTGNSTLSLAGGMTMARDVSIDSGTTLFFRDKVTSTISGAVTGDGGINMNPAGFGSISLILSSTGNTFTGPITVGNDSTATLTVNSLADSVDPLELNLSDKGDTTFIWGSGATAPLVLTDRQVVLSGNQTKNHVIGNANADPANTVTIDKDLSITSTTNRKLILQGVNTGNNTIGGVVPDGASGGVTSLEKSGSGTWVLSGANTYTGTTIVTNGTLAGADPQAFGTNLSGISIQGGDTLSLRNDSSVTFGVGATGYDINNTSSNATINVDRTTGTGSNVLTVGDLSTTSTAGTWELNFTGANGVSLSAGSLTTPASSSGTTHTIDNDIAGGGSLTLASVSEPSTNAAPVLNFTGDGDTIVTGDITQTTAALALTKNGSGSLTLGGTQTYEGATDVNSGILIVNGSLAATSDVSVSGTATLGGAGTVGGSVTATASTTIAPGASAGTLGIGGDLDISALAGGAGTLDFELDTNTATSDQIAVTGTLTIGVDELGLSDFTFTDLGGLQNGTYVLITSGGITGGDSLDPDDITGTVGAFDAELQINGNNIDLVLSSAAGNPFDTWAGTGTLPGTVTFEGDLNGDGVQDGLAFLLGVANPDDDANGSLPDVSESGGNLIMEFDCLATADRGTATLDLEYDGDLTGTWLSAPVPGAVGAPNPIDENTATGTVSYVATANGSLIHIVATITDATESAGGKLFGRLEATE